jgi:hypothetical protein
VIPTVSQFWAKYGAWWPRCLNVTDIGVNCQLPALWSAVPGVPAEPRCEHHRGGRLYEITEGSKE